MTTSEKRVEVYRALRECCWDRPAHIDTIEVVLSYEEPLLQEYLEGMVSLRELRHVHLNRSLPLADGFGHSSFGFDDAAECAAEEGFYEGYQLTEFGQRWTELMLAGTQPSER